MIFRCFSILFLLFYGNVQAKITKKAGAVEDGKWKGKWFPYAPGEPHIITSQVNRGENDHSCDDRLIGIEVDYSPSDKRHNFNYLCISSNRSIFEPNLHTEAVLTEHFVPPAFVPQAQCLNETISYEDQLPTFGNFRPIPAKYGSYTYLPPQRWMRNLAEGAIVVLYHPCANQAQTALLQRWVQACLYKNIVTPSQRLSAERPFALLAWGLSLEMSVVDETIVTDFVKKHAKHGPLRNNNLKESTTKTYTAGLIAEAHLVTDEDDSEICGYNNM